MATTPNVPYAKHRWHMEKEFAGYNAVMLFIMHAGSVPMHIQVLVVKGVAHYADVPAS